MLKSGLRGRGAELDLTTFDHVPWNREYYERLGFGVLREEDLGKEMCQDVREELLREKSDDLLGRWERVAMRKMLLP
jgi:hypothetical protein